MDMLTFSGDDPLGMTQVGVWEVKDKVCAAGKDGRSHPLCTSDGEPERYERWYEQTHEETHEQTKGTNADTQHSFAARAFVLRRHD